MALKNAVRSNAIEGTFRHLIYSPKGAIEGVLFEADGAPAQIVFERDDAVSPAAFEALAEGQAILVEAEPMGPSKKGEAEHPVYSFGRLVKVDGRAPPKARAAAAETGYAGTIVRFNYARHGAANGVVLDTGDFIHTKPEGLEGLKLQVGDKVRAEGEARPLVTGEGMVVEAWSLKKQAKPRKAA
ncbi:hypothetical protein BH11PSE8_BH11PSE8_11830 [soil metagenome]